MAENDSQQPESPAYDPLAQVAPQQPAPPPVFIEDAAPKTGITPQAASPEKETDAGSPVSPFAPGNYPPVTPYLDSQGALGNSVYPTGLGRYVDRLKEEWLMERTIGAATRAVTAWAWDTFDAGGDPKLSAERANALYPGLPERFTEAVNPMAAALIYDNFLRKLDTEQYDAKRPASTVGMLAAGLAGGLTQPLNWVFGAAATTAARAGMGFRALGPTGQLLARSTLAQNIAAGGLFSLGETSIEFSARSGLHDPMSKEEALSSIAFNALLDTGFHAAALGGSWLFKNVKEGSFFRRKAGANPYTDPADIIRGVETEVWLDGQWVRMDDLPGVRPPNVHTQRALPAPQAKLGYYEPDFVSGATSELFTGVPAPVPSGRLQLPGPSGKAVSGPYATFGDRVFYTPSEIRFEPDSLGVTLLDNRGLTQALTTTGKLRGITFSNAHKFISGLEATDHPAVAQVMAFLREHGISETKIMSKGKGKKAPVEIPPKNFLEYITDLLRQHKAGELPEGGLQTIQQAMANAGIDGLYVSTKRARDSAYLVNKLIAFDPMSVAARLEEVPLDPAPRDFLMREGGAPTQTHLGHRFRVEQARARAGSGRLLEAPPAPPAAPKPEPAPIAAPAGPPPEAIKLAKRIEKNTFNPALEETLKRIRKDMDKFVTANPQHSSLFGNLDEGLKQMKDAQDGLLKYLNCLRSGK